MAILRGKRLRWPDWTGSHASDGYGTALAPSGDKRRDKDRTRTTTRRAETLLHIQASKRPMSPARAGLLFSRTIHCNRDGAATVQRRTGHSPEIPMKLVIYVAAALIALAAWNGGSVSLASD